MAGCGCNDCNCPPGPQGPQGTQGVQGVQGVQGQQGPQGPQGSSSDCDCNNPAWFSIYASLSQTIGPNASLTQDVLFDQVASISSASDFDLSLALSQGKVKFLKHGYYDLGWILQGKITPPIPSPVPSWSFGFYLNNVLIPGSIFSGFNASPNDDATHTNSRIIVEVKVNDILNLRNTSASSVDLDPNPSGSIFPITIASMIASKIKDLP